MSLLGPLERRATVYSATAYCRSGLRFRGVQGSVEIAVTPCFTCFLHSALTSKVGHTRVLLAFYTPSVTSKSLLISLLFLERPIFVFQSLSVWRSLVLALHLFRPACFWVRWDTVHDFTSVLYPSEMSERSIFYLSNCHHH